jgi:Na+-translocating ferredoxin:NAD+ oxidoreductase RnfA subunit
MTNGVSLLRWLQLIFLSVLLWTILFVVVAYLELFVKNTAPTLGSKLRVLLIWTALPLNQ